MIYLEKQRKNIITFLIAFVMLIGSIILSVPTYADAATKVNQKYNPSYGVQYKNINYNNRDVNVMEMDVADAFTEVQLGKAEPLDNLMTVRKRANTYSKSGNKIVGAVNANFYQVAERRPVHLISEDNRLVYAGYINKDPNTYVNEPIAFGMDSQGKGLIDHYNLKLTYTYNGKTHKISHTNRKRNTNNTILYTSDFYKKTTNTNKYGTEVVLKGPKNPELTLGSTVKLEVDSIRKEGDTNPIKISDDYFVLSGHGKASTRLKKMKVGDTVEINVGMDKKWQKSEFMLAGGPQLVKNGKVNVSMNLDSWVAKTKTARTAVGVDKSRNKVFFVTVDSPGMDMKQLAKLMKDMGAHTALNLDGGGSTTMVVLPKGGGSLKVANTPSDGFERAISGILMAADTEPKRIFSDVSYRNDHFEGINWLKEKGIQGYPNNTYGIYEQLTRQHAAIIFTNTLGLEKTDAEVAAELFNDIDVSKTYAEFIGAVGQAGIYKGHDGDFLPYDTMTREQMATTIVNAFGLEEASEHVDINMKDVDSSHQKNVQILADYGITVALDDFRPREPVTRAQFATFLYETHKVKQ